jgi:hypothetical protein
MTSFSGTTVGTDFQLSDTDDLLPSNEVEEENGNVRGTRRVSDVWGELIGLAMR